MNPLKAFDMAVIALILCMVGTASAVNIAYNDQVECILQHMLTRYVSTSNITYSNVARLFDAISIDYHINSSYRHSLHDPSKDRTTATSATDRKKRGIHNPDGTISHDFCKAEVDNSLHKCEPASKLLTGSDFNVSDTGPMNISKFLKICPLLVFQLTMTPCVLHPHDHLHSSVVDSSATTITPDLAWLGGILSVLIISAVGMAIIAIIPRMKRALFKAVIQFLVALAVGTLVGDALLHLLPHALKEEKATSDNGHNHSSQVWHACPAVAGIFIFFNAERLLGVFTSIKRDRKRLLDSQRKTGGAPEEAKSVADSCGSCAEVSIIVGHSSREMRKMATDAHRDLHALNHMPCRQSSEVVTTNGHCDACHQESDAQEAKPKLVKIASFHTSLPALNLSTAEFNTATPSKEEMTPMLSKAPFLPSLDYHYNPARKQISPNQNYASGEQKDHLELDPTHSDGHGHSHEVPSSCTSVAYMVIMGDGLHNFTDGLAIGAAFASSFTGGMSTAIAVLCHELPHELGDFAMLLKAGTTVKQAFLCNLLSACLQLIGVIIGIAVGHLGDSTQWLFAFAGGIFLYVALVDMLPEISKVDHQRVWTQLLLQNLGLVVGFGIMLTVAVFEHDIEHAFMQTDQGHQDH